MARSVALLSPEERLLLLAAGPPANDAAIAALAREPLDWARVATLAGRERALPPLVRRLRRAVGGALPAAAPLTALAQPMEFRLHLAQARLHDALRALARADVVPVLLKGAALAHDVYDGLPERPMGDVDLLVHPDELSRALPALEAAGWRRGTDVADDRPYADHHHLPPLDDTTNVGPTIELHTGLFGAGHPFPEGAEALSPDGIRRRARIVVLGDATVRLPDHVDLVLHAALHFAWSHLLRSAAWRTFRDVGVLLAAGDVAGDTLVARTRATRAGSCLYWTLRLARVLAGVATGPLEDAVRPPGSARAHRRLEEHFARGLLAAEEARCPSARLERALWCLALRPGASGHGAARPWDRDALFVAAAAGPGDAPGGLAVRRRIERAARATWYGTRLVLGA